ncbi:hypothetical protein XA68_16826 [Ophiocordyceps unilateralis]|uniref:Carrier domain-containing protein n=1 Tax=Ophiocordyceps unilateralis TaxID=268505 RepID=A0A2A9P5W5_OPHUN|nr:hypothetical protein XA68_16826 [Ophiocordyceps unilateralis]
MEDCDFVPYPTLPPSASRPAADTTICHDFSCRRGNPSADWTMATLVRASWALVSGHQSGATKAAFAVLDEPKGRVVVARVEWEPHQKVCSLLETVQKETCRHVVDTREMQTLLIIRPEGSKPTERCHNYALVVELQLVKDTVVTATATLNSQALTEWQGRNLLQRLDVTLSQVINAGPDTNMGEIEPLTTQDMAQLWLWNKTVPVAIETSVDETITAVANSQPDAPAVCAWDGELTYGELDRLATVLAARLVLFGVGPDVLVPACFEKSVWTTVAILAVVKSAGAFVLLDPSLPEKRLRAIVCHTRAPLLLCSSSKETLCSRLAHTLLVVGPALSTDKVADPALLLTRALDPSSLAYVVFTSGSTGNPKGVMITHRNLASALHHQADVLGYSAGCRILDFSSYSFDVSIANLFRALSSGGCLCVPSDEHRKNDLEASIARLRANVAHLTPSVARLLRPDHVPGLKCIHLGGEPVSLGDVEPWWDRVRVLSGYGPSECTTASTFNRSPSSPDELVDRIGKGAGLVTWVVDARDHHRLVPPGCVGELLLEGPLVGRGYLADPDRTATSFIHDPAWLVRGPAARHGRLYKTGDLVRQTGDGSLLFVGRKDAQIKIRGQRVELGEVEHRLRQFMPEARRVVADVITSDRRLPSLAAFLLMDEARTPARMLSVSAEVRDKLADHLPSYMVPTLFFSVPEIPMTATGKTDRRRLCETGAACVVQGLLAAPASKPQPTSPLERELQGILAHGLGVEPASLGLHDCFFRLGGDSLGAIKVVSRAREAGIRLAVADIYRQSMASIQNLARFVAGSQDGQPRGERASMDLMAEIARHDAVIASSHRGVVDGVVNGVTNGITNGIPPQPPRPLTVLLTGANGFIGTQILRQLLDHRLVGRVIALVRGKTNDSARGRTVEAARRAMWWSDVYGEKLDVWAGDLALPRLGLDDVCWSHLATAADVVVHNGALVHYMASYAALEAVNVGSTVELLRLRTRLVYVSTARCRDPAEEQDEDVATELAGEDAIAYNQSKFVAEAVVRRAALRRGPLDHRHAVVSPGFVIGTPTEGVANADDYLWRLAAACIRKGVYNRDEADVWIPLSDAATAAKTIVDTALNARPLVTQIKGGMSLGDFWAALRGLGYRLEPASASDWLAAVGDDMEASGDEHPLKPLAHMLHVPRGRVRWADSWREDSVAPVRLKAAVRKSAQFLAQAEFLPRLASGTQTVAGVAFSRTGR